METTEIVFIKPSLEYAKEIREYRREFLDVGDHMDGCGPLRKYEDPKKYIEVCGKKSDPDTAEAAGGQAEQFLLVRKTDNRLVGMAQYRFGADPRFCIGYSVRPSERKKGYAKMALQNLLQWLKDRGQVSTMISCEPSNEASRKVILQHVARGLGTLAETGTDDFDRNLGDLGGSSGSAVIVLLHDDFLLGKFYSEMRPEKPQDCSFVFGTYVLKLHVMTVGHESNGAMPKKLLFSAPGRC